jgi:hypothetical protein
VKIETFEEVIDFLTEHQMCVQFSRLEGAYGCALVSILDPDIRAIGKSEAGFPFALADAITKASFMDISEIN